MDRSCLTIRKKKWRFWSLQWRQWNLASWTPTPKIKKKITKIDVVAITNIPKNKQTKETRKQKEICIIKRVNYESEKLQHCHVAVVTGGTSGCGWIFGTVAIRFLVRVCRRCCGRCCARRLDTTRWWFESVSTWPPFPQADYAVLGSAASCHSLLDALLDTRRRTVRIADRLHEKTKTTKEIRNKFEKQKRENVIDGVLSTSALRYWHWIIGWVW